jgi:drug/metabolite transporter (DMT)-like permease
MSASPTTVHRPGTAIALKLSALFLFIVMSGMIKAATQTVPPGQAVFFRSSCAIPVIALWLTLRGELMTGLIPRSITAHVWRGLFGTAGMGLTFAGLALLPLPEVTAIGYATPIFTVLLAALMLGERIRLVRISAVGLGLVGVIIVMYPRLTVDDLTSATSLGALMVLAASILRALVQIHIRQMVEREHTAAIVFWFSVTASVLSLATIPFGWVMPSNEALWLMVGAGLIGGVAQMLVTSAYRYGPASMLAPFDYASMIFAVLIGWLWFDEWPTTVMLIGAGLVISGGALIIWRERQLGLEGSPRARAVIDPKG